MSRDYIIHTPDEIERIRVAAAMTGKARDLIADSVRPGMSTKELDLIAGEIITSMGGKCAFLGYAGFPGNICISVNDEVVHGIGDPNRFILKGDLVKVDVGVAFNGGIGDTARTVYVGDEPCPADEQKLMDVTRGRFPTTSPPCAVRVFSQEWFLQSNPCSTSAHTKFTSSATTGRFAHAMERNRLISSTWFL